MNCDKTILTDRIKKTGKVLTERTVTKKALTREIASEIVVKILVKMADGSRVAMGDENRVAIEIRVETGKRKNRQIVEMNEEKGQGEVTGNGKRSRK